MKSVSRFFLLAVTVVLITMSLWSCGSTTDTNTRKDRNLVVEERHRGVDGDRQFDYIITRTEKEQEVGVTSERFEIQAPQTGGSFISQLTANGGIPWTAIATTITAAAVSGSAIYLRNLNKIEDKKIKERTKST